jgi:hypothetical protein
MPIICKLALNLKIANNNAIKALRIPPIKNRKSAGYSSRKLQYLSKISSKTA